MTGGEWGRFPSPARNGVVQLLRLRERVWFCSPSETPLGQEGASTQGLWKAKRGKVASPIKTATTLLFGGPKGHLFIPAPLGWLSRLVTVRHLNCPPAVNGLSRSPGTLAHTGSSSSWNLTRCLQLQGHCHPGKALFPGFTPIAWLPPAVPERRVGTEEGWRA